ncbi:MAG: hypothetical protein VXW65_03885 [Pseudomonadota bacterium]|nr:hypothetical protein [Pseudomonadota bacterium]
MNAVNENMNPETAKKHNPRIPYIAAANMGKQFMDLMLQEFKAAPDVWQKMNSQQQSEVIERIRQRVQYATAGAVNTIVTGGHTALAGQIESIAKKDKIKLTVIIDRNNNSDAMHEFYLADSGAPCQILMADAAQYCDSMELVEADPDQPALFGNEPELPDDQLLWAVNVPMLTGATIAPAPHRKDAELYARSIREKLIELDRTEFATNVYALPWPMNRGEHMRSYNKGNWEALINWFSQLCAGEVEVKPVVLISHAPEPEEVAESEKMTMHYDRVIVTLKDGDFVAVGEFAPLPDTEEYEQEQPKIGYGHNALHAVHNLLNQYEIQGTFDLKDESTSADELAGRRVIDVYLTFDPLVHPEFIQEATAQKSEGRTFDEAVEEILGEEGTAETVAEVVADDYIEMEYQETRKLLELEGRVTTQLSKVGALRAGKAHKFGEQECMFEYVGFDYKGEAKALWDKYRARPLIALTDEHPRIKVTFATTNGCLYRASCNSRSSTSTSSARSAVNNLLKKMALTGQVVEITTLDDIEREVQMFTVIA